MIGSSTNFSTGGVLTEAVSAPGHGQEPRAGVSVSRFEAPAPLLALSYSGRVGTFYSVASATYSETYEPTRPSAYGPIARIESRFVGGRWRHVAYGFSGAPVFSGEEDRLLFEQSSLPLLFDPQEEVRYAQHWLLTLPQNEIVNLPNGVVVYGNKDRSRLGIIRLQLNF